MDFIKNTAIYYYLKQFYFRMKNCYGKNVTLGKGVELDSKTRFEGNNAVYKNTKIKSSFVGYGTYVANGSNISRTKIGRYCAIGDNVSISLGIHPSKKLVSIHPAFFSLNKQSGFTYAKETLFDEHIYVNGSPYCVDIGNDVWIGNNVLIFDGVTIGNGAIIGAGAIVTKSVEDYSIVVGAPAKHVRYRFTGDQIQRLLKFKWWDKDPGWLGAHCGQFMDIEQFLTENDA
jgi:acetyltransferase-like isoleucine patch superfamily enzyme